MKQVVRLIGVLLAGGAVGFGLWKLMGALPIAVWITGLTVIPTLIGLEMSFRPPSTPRAKGVYRTLFGVWAVASCVVAFLQFKQAKPVIPRLPQIAIETFSGLPEGMANNPHLRLNRLLVRNVNEVSIENFCSRLQLPEPIWATVETNQPPGTAIGWRPLTTKVAVNGTGSRSVIGPSSSVNFIYSPACFFPAGNRAQLSGFCEGGSSTGVWELTIDRLPPRSVASMMFLTTNEGEATNYIAFVKTAFTNDGATISTAAQGTTNGSVIIHSFTLAFIVHTNKTINPNEDWRLGTNELRFSLEGLFQYAADGKPGTQHFLLPIALDEPSRRLSCLPVQPNDGKWKRVMIEFQ